MAKTDLRRINLTPQTLKLVNNEGVNKKLVKYNTYEYIVPDNFWYIVIFC